MTSLRRLLPSSGALFVFEAAARYLNFTRAAGELNVTQSAGCIIVNSCLDVSNWSILLLKNRKEGAGNYLPYDISACLGAGT